MSIRKKIEADLQLALKEKNKITISTLRLIIAGIKDKDIAFRSKDNKEGIKEDDIKQLLKKMIKQRNESIEIYKKSNRNDLLDIEKKEVQIISKFLPKQFSEEETNKICKETINKVGATSVKDMGKVMGMLKKNYADVLDFSRAGLILKNMLK
jgi:uncharacterized protein YqeY|tara:strand:- start:61 stop:519 length:459 start_codon:yes stop_codon:yes gene_type:complete